MSNSLGWRCHSHKEYQDNLKGIGIKNLNTCLISKIGLFNFIFISVYIVWHILRFFVAIVPESHLTTIILHHSCIIVFGIGSVAVRWCNSTVRHIIKTRRWWKEIISLAFQNSCALYDATCNRTQDAVQWQGGSVRGFCHFGFIKLYCQTHCNTSLWQVTE